VSGRRLCVGGFHAATISGENPARWLHATLGVPMMLIVVAMSRISKRTVNGATEEEAGGDDAEYRAGPPPCRRRRLSRGDATPLRHHDYLKIDFSFSWYCTRHD
jgi:hypothetical protein